MRGRLADIRKRIYREMRKKHPDMKADSYELLHTLMRERICVSMLVGKLTDTYDRLPIWISPPPTNAIGCFPPEASVFVGADMQMFIDAFHMARELCAGMIKITVHKLRRGYIIRVS